jgi:AAA+ ATPase superfamily predicted ATPase
VGKTSLLGEFVAGKPRAHYATARRTSAHENLAALSAAVLSRYDQDASLAGQTDAPVFADFAAALEHVFREARSERTLFVIDEYPYLAECYSGISSLLQTLIDREKAQSKLMLVLCGSSMSFMEHQVLGEKSPLYGRRTAQIRLAPFDYRDARELLGTNDPVRAVELYALAGGVPLYLEQLDADRSTEENIARKLLNTGSYLYAEPQNYLLQEVKAPATYNAVIEAVAKGATRPVDVANACGLAAPNVSDYLARLAELGVVARELPVGSSNKRQVRYRLNDNLFNFWYTFVPRYEGAVELGQGAAVAQRIVRKEFADYMGHAFEDVCRQWLARSIAAGRYDLLLQQLGSWWGTDPHKREQTDVDVVALGADGELVAGECKWRNAPVGAEVLETLAYRAALVKPDARKVDLVLFSKSGFADSCRREAQARGNVALVDAADLFA